MKGYIPKTKDDFEAIEQLKTSSFEEIIQDSYKLLEWMQDLHWDVSQEIGKYFIPYVNEIKNDLIKILNSDDNEWKFGIMVCLIMKSSKKLDSELISVLKRIAESPTKGEILEELNIKANEILESEINKK